MSHDLQQAFSALAQWVDTAMDQGWLTETDRNSLNRIERATADDLFVTADKRPLVVGLFGGTGVGKSSLLNRLAGETIAKVGVERPTSREVTLYMHESHALASLPEEFPVNKTRVAHHRDDAKRDVLWIDMPDIDSTETANRKLVFAWLPYIDWVIYVVSPERYRDDAGWQIVRRRGHRHQWLFVMNQWDMGTEEQIEEFVSDLEHAGFDEPTVLTSSCAENARPDEFEHIEQTIREAIDSHGLAELKRLGVWARLRDLEQLRAGLKTRFGDDITWGRFVAAHRAHAQQILSKLRESMRWPIETIANRFRDRERGWPGMRRSTAPDSVELSDLRSQLWSTQSQYYVDDIVSQAVIETEVHGIATTAVQRSIHSSLAPADDTMIGAAKAGLERALSKPGTPVLRGVRALARLLMYLLPVAAIAWAGYYVVNRYQRALSGVGDFLSIDFAIHSLLLILLAWLAPFVIYRLVRPSLRASARRGLESGVYEAVRMLIARLEEAYQQLGRGRAALLESLDALRS